MTDTLKSILKTDLVTKEEIVKLSREMIHRQLITIALTGMVALAVILVFAFQATKPLQLNQAMMRTIEDERAALAVERTALRRQRAQISQELESLQKLRTQFAVRDSVLLQTSKNLERNYEKLSDINRFNNDQIKQYFTELK